MPRRPHRRWGRGTVGALVIALGPVLAACGGGATDAPTAPPAASTASAGTTQGTDAAVAAGDAAPAAGSPSGAPAAAGTPGAAAPRTVGELADRVAAAWAGIGAYRIVETTGAEGAPPPPLPVTPAPGATPPAASGAAPGPASSIDEVILPDRRHLLIGEAGGTTEFVAVGGRIAARGDYARIGIRPSLDPTTWVALDPVGFAPDSPLAGFVADFAGPAARAFAPPLANLSAETRARELTPLGPVAVEGRACEAYRVADTTATGDRVEVTLAVDAAGLPCSEETRAGGTSTRRTYGAFNAVPPIAFPADAVPLSGTPAA